jgi:hypothetical protein
MAGVPQDLASQALALSQAASQPPQQRPILQRQSSSFAETHGMSSDVCAYVIASACMQELDMMMQTHLR